MNISAIQPKIDASHISLEDLANNRNVSEEQKITEVSKQFEAILLRQILSESQKTVIKSEFTDESSTASIYQDFVTNQLADSLVHSGGIGLAATFQRQLSPPTAPVSGQPLAHSAK